MLSKSIICNVPFPDLGNVLGSGRVTANVYMFIFSPIQAAARSGTRNASSVAPHENVHTYPLQFDGAANTTPAVSRVARKAKRMSEATGERSRKGREKRSTSDRRKL